MSRARPKHIIQNVRHACHASREHNIKTFRHGHRKVSQFSLVLNAPQGLTIHPFLRTSLAFHLHMHRLRTIIQLL